MVICLEIPAASNEETGSNLWGWDGPANVLVTVDKSNSIVLAYVAFSKASAHKPLALA